MDDFVAGKVEFCFDEIYRVASHVAVGIVLASVGFVDGDGNDKFTFF